MLDTIQTALFVILTIDWGNIRPYMTYIWGRFGFN